MTSHNLDERILYSCIGPKGKFYKEAKEGIDEIFEIKEWGGWIERERFEEIKGYLDRASLEEGLGRNPSNFAVEIFIDYQRERLKALEPYMQME